MLRSPPLCDSSLTNSYRLWTINLLDKANRDLCRSAYSINIWRHQKSTITSAKLIDSANIFTNGLRWQRNIAILDDTFLPGFRQHHFEEFMDQR